MAREKVGNDIKGANRATDMSYNDWAGALKVLGPVQGVFKILGALDAGVQTPQFGATVAVYNNSTTTAFVAVYPQTGAAPTGGANGIAVPPNSYIYVSMGANQFIIANAATCFGYQVIDESYLSPGTAQGFNPNVNPNPTIPVGITTNSAATPQDNNDQ
jgi:hypothetical protein